ncbi:hypothetical protein ERO13_A13G067600v2 [Gossypium hirsutum]|uniref:Peptidase C14 caspase domain-containing protein n=1 Tax=Gossypium barbadense TaxID=3634 RepID=A0A5J5SW23_GOSBA|nr:hypothetical protein ES319_A13G073200v1 [Gossypium barbadense]KAG4165257.1 hypothetical protein ERO13_A13G067600v2 [Gossypium hirsutum]
MEIKIICHRCKQKFSASTTTEIIICPQCRTVIPNRTPRKQSPPSGGHYGSSIPSLIDNLLKKLCLALKPATAPGLSSFVYPKSCGLDNVGTLGNKRAVLCGVSYKKWKYKLKGTINDVFNMRALLIQYYEYRDENMLILTEEQPDARLIPTKANIESSLKWLVKDCRSGDSLVFYYSGHGLRQPDFEDDEIDGFDETICPVDFLKEGMIVDNDIYKTIVQPLTEGVWLHAIVDACHSGTILDLEHYYDNNDNALYMFDHLPQWVRALFKESDCNFFLLRLDSNGKITNLHRVRGNKQVVEKLIVSVLAKMTRLLLTQRHLVPRQ